MNAITKMSLRNGIPVIILCLLVIGYGLYSTTLIKQQTFPDVSFPAVFIQAVYQGGSTEEVETEITNPIEQSLLNLKGFDSLTSTSSENASSIFVQYPFGTNMDNMTKNVEGAIAKLTLPSKSNVTVHRLSPGSQPIYEAAIFSTNNDPAALQKTLQDQIVPKLQKIAGVSTVTLSGTKSQELRIEVDKKKASEKGISLSAIQSAIQSLDYAVPLGSVTQNEASIPIRLVGHLHALQQIKDLELIAGGGSNPAGQQIPSGGPGGSAMPTGNQAPGGTQSGTGGLGAPAQTPATATANPAVQKVKLSDIAQITTLSTQNEITRYNGEESYLIQVVKNQDANTADVANNVKSLLADEKNTANLDIHVISDSGKDIQESISSLVREGLYGAMFCIVVIFLFLRNIRATLISIISLPISVFATIALLNQLGFTLNIMTLGGLAVSIGRIVDDSIVVIENIYRWRQEKGKDMKGKELAYNATKEVISAISSSTLATLVVFLPLGFVSGIIGEFFRPFSYAVVFSIITSLLVAMMLIPVLGSKFISRVKPHREGGRFIAFFEKLLRGALRRKGWVLGLALLLLAGSLSTIPLLGVSFLPTGSTPSIQIALALPSDKNVAETNDLTQKVETYVKGINGVTDYQATVGGGSSGREFSQAGKTSNKATVNVQLQASIVVNDIIDKINNELTPIVTAAVPNTAMNVTEAAGTGPPSGNDVQVSLYSNDLNALNKATGQVDALLKQNSLLKNISNNMKEVTPKWVIAINQKGMDEHISYMQVMQAVTEQLKPVDVGTYTLDNQQWKITMSYQQQITSKEQLENIQIQTASGLAKLKDIADVTETTAPITVNHDNGKTYAQLSAVIKGSNTTTISKAVQTDIQSLSLPSGVDVKFGGGLTMINQGFSSLGIAMASAVGLVFLVLSMTFGGIRIPLIILSSLLFVPAGSLTGLLIMGQTLSMSAMIGMLMLVGIVVTNAVVLLDRIEKNLNGGMPLTEGIVEASKTRLRPILMTAFATMLALLPLAMSHSSSPLISQGLAITVIGGLFSSTLLTLIVIPVIYQMTGNKRKLKADRF